MINLSINREPFRAEQELLSVHTGIAKYLHSLFHPKGFFILGCVTLLNTSRLEYRDRDGVKHSAPAPKKK